MITSNLGASYSSKRVKAKVELYNGSTLVETCTCDNYLSDFTITREGELGKFFGFGVCHQLNMKLIDLDKTLALYEGFTTEICLGDGNLFDCPYPTLTVTSVSVDKKSGDITVTAYDPIYKASELTFKDLSINAPYTIRTLAEACGAVLGVSVVGVSDSVFDLEYQEGFNYNEDEPVRTVLNQIAEATQRIYYINHNNELQFKQLSPVSIKGYTSNDYYEFETAQPKTIKNICHATELGNNLMPPDVDTTDGVIQYVRNNGLWELRSDIATLLEEAVNRVSGLTLNQFALDWTGDYRLEVGDCITVYYENEATDVFVLNDSITYDSTLSEQTSWSYEASEGESSNSTNIGDKINQTFAKVDKIEKNITLYVSDIVEEQLGGINESISQLQVNTNGIIASVSSVSSRVTGVDENLTEFEDNTNTRIDTLTQEVGLKVDSEAVTISVEKRLAEGVEKVVTSTKHYVFGDEGLHISSGENYLNTTITKSGMTVSKGGEEVLVANDQGVIAEDLHATTYLIIGNLSRFEDYNGRTTCFWIGG